MILVKAPLRISFFGGGTDLASHYREHGGAVLSVAIDKYMYIAVNKTPVEHIKLSYSEIELVHHYRQLKHDIARNVIKTYGGDYTSGIEISSFADVPTVGTGLGSSSTFTVAMIEAMATMNGIHLSNYELAAAACDIEINQCGSPIGKQDQYASAFGGMNHITFYPDEFVHVKPLLYYQPELDAFNSKLMMFYTGITRSANAILTKQNAEPKHEILSAMKEQADHACDLFNQHKYDDFGALLYDAWKLKAQLADGITDPHFDNIFEEAMRSGALGGKLLGAGGGGYFLFYVPEASQVSVYDTMKRLGLQHFPFKFSRFGTETVYNDNTIF